MGEISKRCGKALVQFYSNEYRKKFRLIYCFLISEDLIKFDKKYRF